MFADGTSGADRYRGQVKYNHQDNYMSFATDATERMRIDSSGIVNIGTATGTQPSYFNSYLNVQNNASTSNHASITITAGSSGYAGLHFGDSDNGRIGQVAYNNSNNSLLFTANNSTRMTIDSDGNVGIGDTTGTSPNSADRFLKIGKSNLQDCSIILQDAVETWEIYQNDDLQFSFGTTPTTVMTMQRTTGNVGIGTASPNTQLEIKGNSTNSFLLNPLYGIGQNIFFNGSAWDSVNHSVGGSIIQLGTDGSFAFRRATAANPPVLSYSMYIDSSGKVGIGGGTTEGKLSIDYTAAELPTSGTTSNSAIQVTSSLGNQLNLGLNTVSGDYGAYIQASDNNLAVPYPLNLQPNGGNVGIGGGAVTSPASVGTFLNITGRDGIGAGTAGIVLKDYDTEAWDIWNSSGILNFRYNNGASGAGNGLSIDATSNATFAGSTLLDGLASDGYRIYKIRLQAPYTGGWGSITPGTVIGGLQQTNFRSDGGTSNIAAAVDFELENNTYGTGQTNISFKCGGVNGADSTEKMRITSGGTILFGSETLANVLAGDGAAFAPESNNRMTLFQGTNTTSAMTQQAYYNPNGQVGRINTTGTTTQFLGSSDYRLKEDLQDFAGLDIVSKIPVYDFKWKTDESRSYGVMAHELQEVLPDAVAGEKDDVNEDGSVNPQGVDYSKIVPLLVKSIQELKAEIDDLKNKCNCK
jgi:hypothetical protein